MTPLDYLPVVETFINLDLRTGAFIIAALGIVHPMAYSCSFFIPVSYLLVTLWILVALYSAASVALFWGLVQENTVLCTIWIWYAAVFMVLMIFLMILLVIFYASQRQCSRVFVVILAILWYLLTVYFILVVNSHKKSLENEKTVPSATAISFIDEFSIVD